MGFVYLIHFNTKLHHAQHYIGYSEEDPEKDGGRIESHRNGTGARIMKAVMDKGITFQVARVWVDKDRAFEWWLKNQKNAGRFCPICKQNKKLGCPK